MSPNLLSGAARMAGSSLLRMQSDERLVALIRDGHDPAFTAVVDRYGSELQRYSARIVGDGRAEDVVQQAFLNAHTAIMSSSSEINLRPWLYRIAHNAGLNVLRSSREQVELDDRLPSAGGIEQDVETRERLREALAAIAKLPEPQRDALTLRAIEGRSHAEIAAVLGVTPGAARQHLHRARGTVRAVVSAVTPYGFMARFAMAGSGEPATATLLGGASVGLGATVAKVGAGVLAAGAIATGTTGHVPFTGHHAKPRPATRQSSAPASAAEAAAAVPIVAPTAAVTHLRRIAVSTPSPSSSGHRGSSDGGDRSGSGGSSSGGPGPSSSSGGGSDDHSGEQVSRHSGRKDDGGSSGSGSSGSGSSGDDSAVQDDHSGSGSSSGSGDGSGEADTPEDSTIAPTQTDGGSDRSGSSTGSLTVEPDSSGSGSSGSSGGSGHDGSDDVAEVDDGR